MESLKFSYRAVFLLNLSYDVKKLLSDQVSAIMSYLLSGSKRKFDLVWNYNKWPEKEPDS